MTKPSAQPGKVTEQLSQEDRDAAWEHLKKEAPLTAKDDYYKNNPDQSLTIRAFLAGIQHERARASMEASAKAPGREECSKCKALTDQLLDWGRCLDDMKEIMGHHQKEWSAEFDRIRKELKMARVENEDLCLQLTERKAEQSEPTAQKAPAKEAEAAAEEYAGVQFIRWCNNRQPSIQGAKAEQIRDAYLAGDANGERRARAELEAKLESLKRRLELTEIHSKENCQSAIDHKNAGNDLIEEASSLRARLAAAEKALEPARIEINAKEKEIREGRKDIKRLREALEELRARKCSFCISLDELEAKEALSQPAMDAGEAEGGGK